MAATLERATDSGSWAWVAGLEGGTLTTGPKGTADLSALADDAQDGTMTS